VTASERQALTIFLRGRIEAVRAAIEQTPRTPENVALFAEAGQIIAGLRALLTEFEK
jgi:hypothetical protein